MKKNKGFTIIELLTVIAIIALIMSIMVPGMKKAKQVAIDLKQKSKLRDIGIGLELWAYDNDSEYPDSTALGASIYTTGAHLLAEALLGRDGQGFDSLSTGDAEADAATGIAYTSTLNRNSKYLESEDVEMFQLAQIYGDNTLTGSAYSGDYNADASTTGEIQAGVLTDIYKNRKIVMPITNKNIKIGSPILYFKAKDTDIFNDAAPTTSVFNHEDNVNIFALGHNVDGVTNPHPYDTITNFYSPNSSLINDSIRPITDPVPYNKTSFILLSAGSDGLYGTKDDIINISK